MLNDKNLDVNVLISRENSRKVVKLAVRAPNFSGAHLFTNFLVKSKRVIITEE